MFLCEEQRPLMAPGYREEPEDDTLGPGDFSLPWMGEAVLLQCPKLRDLESTGVSWRVRAMYGGDGAEK